MPSRPEWLAFYRSAEWAAIRERILRRSNGCCEICRKPHGKMLKVTRGGYWFDEEASKWRDRYGDLFFGWPSLDNWPKRCGTIYCVRSVVTVAHLNRQPVDNRDENLQALCQHCRLKFEIEAMRASVGRAVQ